MVNWKGQASGTQLMLWDYRELHTMYLLDDLKKAILASVQVGLL